MTNTKSAYIRKDGRYECRIFLGRDSNGKSHYKSVYGKTEAEAVRKREIFVRSENTAAVDVPEALYDAAFTDIAEELLNSKNMDIKVSTYGNYRMKLDVHIIPYFGEMSITAIAPKLIYDFIADKQADGLSVRYISDMLIILKAIFRYAGKTYGIKNVFDHITMPKCHKYEVKILSDNELKRLISLLMGTHDRRDLGILLAVHLGLRIGEICGLKWSDVDIVNGLIYIRRTVQRVKSKGGKTKTEVIVGEPKSEKSRRAIPICRELLDILKHFKSDDNNYIISDLAKPAEPRVLQYYFKRILINGKFSSVTFHSLRHAFATKAIASGCDMKYGLKITA